MGITLTLSQQRACDSIIKRSLEGLDGDNNKKHTTFYAMTGAGKTVVMSKMIENLIKFYKGDIAFMWMSPGDGSLHLQSYYKLVNNLPRHIKCTLLDKTIRGISYISKNEVAVINWEKINKKNNTLMEDGDYVGFPAICENTKESNKLCLIIDESHINNTENAAYLISKINPDITISMSATPLQSPDIRITHEELVDEEVIKKRIIVNDGVTEFKEKNTDIDNLHVALECAYKQQLVLKKALLKEGSNINPLILVQVPNRRKGVARIESVKAYFNSKGINESNNNLAVWVTKSKGETDVTITTPGFDKESVKDDDSPIDVLVFKQAISTGWDCQRAYIWVKLRDNMSERFEVQTVGRVNRQPNRKYFDNEILNVGYVYTDDMNFEVKSSEYEAQFIYWLPSKLKEGIELSLLNHYRKWDDRVIILSSTKDSVGFHDVLTRTFNNKLGIVDNDIYKNLDLLKSKGYDVSTGILPSYMIGDSFVEVSDLAKGFFKADAEKLKGKASSYEIIERFEEKILGDLSYCGIAKNSYTNVRGALIRWSIDYLGFSRGTNYDPLYSFFIRNWGNLGSFFIDAIESYKIERAKDKLNKLKSKPIEELWSLKQYYHFNDDNYELVEYNKYAYDKCYLNKNRSEIEKAFADDIDNNEMVEWWYKNMDGGREHFSVYYKYDDKYNLFYVDFIIKLKNGRIVIIDTKEDWERMQSEKGINKSIGLQRYIKEQQDRGQNISGGIVTRNKIKKLKIWDKEDVYMHSDMLDDWQDLNNFLN